MVWMRIKGSATLPKVLSTLLNVAVAFSSPNPRTSRGAYQAFRRFDELQALTDRQLQDTVRHAISGKYIIISGAGKERRIVLTKKGAHLVNRAALAALRPPRPAQWDKKWRIVLFDIPEGIRKNRNSFAVGLKRMGFVSVQKSCFVFPFPCFEEVEALADFCEVHRYITCALAELLEGTSALRKHYRL